MIAITTSNSIKVKAVRCVHSFFSRDGPGIVKFVGRGAESTVLYRRNRDGGGDAGDNLKADWSAALEEASRNSGARGKYRTGRTAKFASVFCKSA